MVCTHHWFPRDKTFKLSCLSGCWAHTLRYRAMCPSSHRAIVQQLLVPQVRRLLRKPPEGCIVTAHANHVFSIKSEQQVSSNWLCVKVLWLSGSACRAYFCSKVPAQKTENFGKTSLWKRGIASVDDISWEVTNSRTNHVTRFNLGSSIVSEIKSALSFFLKIHQDWPVEHEYLVVLRLLFYLAAAFVIWQPKFLLASPSVIYPPLGVED